MQSYQPSLDLALDYCQGKDCLTITLTDISPTFLEYGKAWLKIKGVTIEVYDQDGNLLGSKDCDFYTQLTGTIAVADDSIDAVGTNTLFESELSAGDYIYLLTPGYEYHLGVGAVQSDTALVLTSFSPEPLSGNGFAKLNLEYELDASHFGGSVGESIPDGIYDIKYIIIYDYIWDNDRTPTTVTAAESYTLETQVIYCNIQCCVAKKLADIATDFITDPCEFANSEEASDAMLAWAWLESLPYLEECGDVDRLQETLDALIDYCGDSNCQNCGK